MFSLTGVFLTGMPVQLVARAMIKDAVDRVNSKDDDAATATAATTTHKIFNNADIYAFNGLASNGKPLKK